MSKVPDPEQLDELGDDAIVAQQADLHEPQRRVQVQVEDRSVVVADAGESERELEKYSAKSTETTVVVRDRRRQADLIADADATFAKRNWAAWVMWLVAGAVAFGIGGLITAIRHPEPAAPAASASAAATADVAPAATNEPPAPTAEPARSAAAADQPAPPALDLDQLPVEHHHRRHGTAAPKKAKPTAPAAHTAAPKPAAAPAPKPEAIPAGI